MRQAAIRKADAIARFETEPNIWLATGSTEGVPHLIPLSLAWDGSRILLATPSDSPTVRNVRSSGRAKASLDSANDVVLLDCAVEVIAFEAANQADVATYVSRVGWDPSDETGAWSLLILTPVTVRAWMGVAEITGRTIMKHGAWLD